MEKKMIVLGAIGNTARQDRDGFRVFSQKGVVGAVCSRDYKGSQLAVKVWKRVVSKHDKENDSKRTNG